MNLFRLRNLIGFAFAMLLMAVASLLIIGAVATGNPGTGVGVGITAISVFFAAISSVANLISVIDMRNERKSQARPYVGAYFEVKSDGLVYFIVENNGNSPAQNVLVEFSSIPQEGYILEFFLKQGSSPFEKPIDFLIPGQALRRIVGVHHEVLGKDKSTEFAFTLAYCSIFGDKYKETIHSDLAYLRGTPFPEKSVGEQIGKLTESVKKLENHLDRISDFDTLFVAVESRDQHRTRIKQLRSHGKAVPKWKEQLRMFLEWLLAKLS